MMSAFPLLPRAPRIKKMKVIGHATVVGPGLEPTDEGLGVWLLGRTLAQFLFKKKQTNKCM